MLKILCFHGWATNSEMLEYQLRNFKKYFPNYQFVTFDGPFSIQEKDIPDPAITNFIKNKNFRAWRPTERKHILLMGQGENMSQTMEYITKFIDKNGPFDGFLGFSQGGYVVDRFVYEMTFGSLKSYDKKPKFAIFVSANPDNSKTPTNFLPSIHMIGTRDAFHELGVVLLSKYFKPVMIIHHETHKFPKLNQEEIDKCRDYIEGIPEIQNKLKALRKMKPKL